MFQSIAWDIASRACTRARCGISRLAKARTILSSAPRSASAAVADSHIADVGQRILGSPESHGEMLLYKACNFAYVVTALHVVKHEALHLAILRKRRHVASAALAQRGVRNDRTQEV